MLKDNTILELYYRLAGDKRTSIEYKELSRKQVKAKLEFEQGIEEEKCKQLEQLLNITYDMSEIENKEWFIEGYKIATQIMAEVYNRNN